MTTAQTIQIYHPLLQNIAYKMVGCVRDAEDIVQEAFLKWLTIDQQKIQNTKAYLISIVTNLCLNHLKSLQRKKEEYWDSWSMAQMMGFAKEDDHELPEEKSKEVAVALSLVEKELKPQEGLVFILREAFQFSYEDLQDVVGKKADNCRKIFSRAKRKIQNIKKEDFNLNYASGANWADNFKNACDIGNASDFVAEFSKKFSKNLKF